MFDQGCLTFYPYSTHFYPGSFPQERKKKGEKKKSQMIKANHLCGAFCLGFRVKGLALGFIAGNLKLDYCEFNS